MLLCAWSETQVPSSGLAFKLYIRTHVSAICSISTQSSSSSNVLALSPDDVWCVCIIERYRILLFRGDRQNTHIHTHRYSNIVIAGEVERERARDHRSRSCRLNVWQIYSSSSFRGPVPFRSCPTWAVDNILVALEQQIVCTTMQASVCACNACECVTMHVWNNIQK